MTENDLLDELTREIKKEERQPGDVSAFDLSKTTGLHVRRCREILNEKAEKGLLLKIEVNSDNGNGNKMFVYRKP